MYFKKVLLMHNQENILSKTAFKCICTVFLLFFFCKQRFTGIIVLEGTVGCNILSCLCTYTVCPPGAFEVTAFFSIKPSFKRYDSRTVLVPFQFMLFFYL
uniref:Uncharacterized protein n=1 Tax=Anguilla anguilla TaxID=7936 RepID=A0A0E9X1S9_ANGAN